MTVIGRDTDNPFPPAPAPQRADQHRPPVDDETMRLLRAPFQTPPPVPDGPNPQATADPDRHDRHRERPNRHPRRGGNRG